MKIKYIRQKCIGCGICANDAPHIWQLSTLDGKAELRDSEIKADYFLRVLWLDEEHQMKEIVKLCPTKAIQLI